MSSVLAVDVGTTTIKCALVNEKYELVSKSHAKAVVEYPRKGWAEKDPDVLWNTIVDVVNDCVSEVDGDVSAIAFSTHMAGVVPVDEDGNPLRKIIIWLDERAAGLPEDLWKGIIKLEGYSLFRVLKFLRITGGAPSRTGKDPISKILWIRDNEPDVFAKAHKFLDVKGFLLKKTADVFVTSPDEAHLTWLADTRNGVARWSESLLRDYGLDAGLLPEIRNSVEVVGGLNSNAASELGVAAGTPVVVGAGDVCSTAVGSGAVRENELHVYIGTSDWVAGHVAKRKTDVSHYIGSLLSAIPNRYLLIAEQEVAAGALEWVMKLVGVEGNYEIVSKLVESAKPGNLIFMPWMYGERAPIDDPFVRAGIINVSLDHDAGDMLRALMEGVALNIKWIYGYMEKMTAKQSAVNAVGGGMLFDVWCQIVADAIRRPLRRMELPQHAAIRGLAAIAFVATGKEESFETAASKYKVDRIFEPDEKNARRYDELFRIYVDLYKKLKGIYRKLNAHGSV